MSRGRKPRVATATLPPKGYYTGHMAPLIAAQEHRISLSALNLWTVLRAHSWRDGRCDLTDRELAAWLGGLRPRHIYNLRAELAAAGLLATVQAEDGVRWLAPLPFRQRQCSNGAANSPEIHFIGNEPVKEEEEVKVNINTIPPPPLPPPPGDFTGNGLPPIAALARFLVEHGAFPGVAAEVAGVLLGRMAREEAEVYSLALLTAAEDSGDARSGRIDGERVLGRWVARMRSGVRPPAWAVAEARDALASDGEALDVGASGGFNPGEAELAAARQTLAGAESAPAAAERAPVGRASTGVDPAGEGPAGAPGDPGGQATGDDGWPSDFAAEAEERPWIVNGSRACSHRELWDRVLSQLRLQLPASTFDSWLRGSVCTGTDDSGRTLVVQVRDRNAADWLNLRLRRLVLRTVEAITGRDDLEVRFEEG